MVEIIKASFVIEDEDEMNGEKILKKLEKYARLCYKSEDKIGEGTAIRLLAKLIKDKHYSVLEHEKITIKIICDRGVSHEIVRHRIASYSQESTRYCNYRSRGVKVIEPLFFLGEENKKKYEIWLRTMIYCEEAYLALLKLGATPQEARTVLPNSLKTELYVTYNIREWRHFFRLRCSKRAHSQMREITIPLLKYFQSKIPLLFDDIQPDS